MFTVVSVVIWNICVPLIDLECRFILEPVGSDTLESFLTAVSWEMDDKEFVWSGDKDKFEVHEFILKSELVLISFSCCWSWLINFLDGVTK